jgi:hypothetical protein
MPTFAKGPISPALAQSLTSGAHVAGRAY